MDDPPSTQSRRHPVRRCLFGKPDLTKLNTWLEEKDEVQRKKDEANWNFDFVNDRPLTGGNVEYEKIPVKKVPVPYRHHVGRGCKASTSKQSSIYEEEEEIISPIVPPSIPPTPVKKRPLPPISNDLSAAECSSSFSSNEASASNRPVTRSCSSVDKIEEPREPKKKSLKQAKLTNYMAVRKRRSVDSVAKNVPFKAGRNDCDAPRSPFRFVEEEPIAVRQRRALWRSTSTIESDEKTSSSSKSATQ